MMPSSHPRPLPYIILAISAAFLFYKYVMQVFPSIMTPALQSTFHLSGAGLGNLAASFFYAYLVTQLFVGVWLDRYSPRLLSTLAIAIAAIGTGWFAIATHTAEALLARALMGAGAAFATVSYMKVSANWFPPHRFALISGLLATAAMLGAIFGQAPLAALMDHVGWRHSLLICSVVGLTIAVLFALFVRDAPTTSLTPTSHVRYRVSWQDIKTLLTKRDNWIITLYSGVIFTPLAVFGGLWGNPFIVAAYHTSNTKAASLISCIFMGLAVGAPILGFISDRLAKRRPVMLFSAFCALMSLACVVYWNTLPVFAVSIFLFSFGFFTGAFMLCFAIGKEMNAATLAASVVALINTGDSIFGSFTEPFIGQVLDWLSPGSVDTYSIHSYHIALSLLLIYLVGGLVLLCFLRAPEGRAFSQEPASL